jgi:hypothetical protein
MDARRETAKATIGGRNTQVLTPDTGKVTYQSISSSTMGHKL